MRILKKLYQAVSNAPMMEQSAPVPSDLTAEKMVTVVTAFFDASNSVIRSVVEELLAEVRTMPSRVFVIATSRFSTNGFLATTICFQRFCAIRRPPTYVHRGYYCTFDW